MNVLVYLVPAALSLGLLGLAGFLWSLKSGQYDDLDGAAWRAIQDDDLPPRDRRSQRLRGRHFQKSAENRCAPPPHPAFGHLSPAGCSLRREGMCAVWSEVA